MKFNKWILGLLTIAITGCTINQQTAAYKTIGAVEATAVNGYDAYCLSVANGTVSATSVPKVAAVFTQLQADAYFAAELSSQGTNAIATTNLLTDASLLTSTIATAGQIK